MLYGPFETEAIFGNKWNNREFLYSFLYLSITGPLVLLVVKPNHPCDFSLVHSILSAQCRLNLGGQIE